MIEIIFIIAAIVCVISALLTVTAHNAVHALLYLVAMMIAIALIFFLFGSPFAAALQIIVYAGAVMVLFVFVTMMLHQGEQSIIDERTLFSLKTAKGPLILAVILVIELLLIGITPLDNSPSLTPLNTVNSESQQLSTSSETPSLTSVKSLAKQLYGPYKLLVIIAAMLLLASLIAAIHIARKSSQFTENPPVNGDSESNASEATP